MDELNLNKIAEAKGTEVPDIPIIESLDKYKDSLFENVRNRMTRGRKYSFYGYDFGFNYTKLNGKVYEYKVSGLNNVLNGLNPELYIITGGSTVGKTTFCRQLMDEIVLSNNWLSRTEYPEGKTYPEFDAKTGDLLYKEKPENNIGCIYFSYEQGRNELQIKTLSRLSLVNGNKINRGTITDKDLQKIENNSIQFDRLWKYQVIVEAEFQTTISEIEKIALQVKDRLDVKHLVIFVDYLQIIKAEIPSLSDVRGIVEYNISELRRLVRKYPFFSVIAISSVARGKEETKGLGTGKESGLIEYTADVVMNMTNNWIETENKNGQGNDYVNLAVDLSIVKNRNNGELKTIPFEFTPSYQRFRQEASKELRHYKQDDNKENNKSK